MIRRWGFTIFFLLALLLSAGVWVASYWRYSYAEHSSVRIGTQAFHVGCGSMYAIASEGWSAGIWRYACARVDTELAAERDRWYRAARYRFLGFAYDADRNPAGVVANRLLIIPLYFPTTLSALALLWACRRQRRLNRTRRGGFEVQPAKPAA